MIKFPANDSPGSDIPKKVYFIILIFSFLWLIIIFMIPVLMHAGGFPAEISEFGYRFFSTVCHQQDERSFHIFEYKLGVCSRCVSIYAGFFLGTVLYPLKYKLGNSDTPSLWILLSASMLLLLDVLLDSAGIVSNSFFSRSVTGFIIGTVLPLYLIPGFVKFFCEVHSFLRNKVST